MPANPTAATVVGNKFVFEYYTTLSQKPENIATFYKAESTLTSGVASFEMNGSSDAQTSVSVGATNIAHSIMASNFKGANVVLSSISCQESLNGGVLVSVLGTIQTKTESGMEPARAFVHVFFLGVQTEPIYSYFVLNDIFTFVNTSVSPSPKQVTNIPYPSAFTVSSAPKEVHHQAHHSPIPTPQPTPAPVSVVVEPPKPAPQPAPHPAPEPAKQPQQPASQPAPQASPIPAPAKTEAPAVTASTSGEKQQRTPKEPKKSGSRGQNKEKQQQSSASADSNNGEFYVKGGDRKNKDNKSPRSQKKQQEPKPEGEQQQTSASSPASQPQQNGEKKQPKRQNSNQGNRKNEKKAENQDKAVQLPATQTTTTTTAAPVKNNSWATVVAVVDNDKPVVFAPPAVVYTEPPKPTVVEEVKVEKKKEERPRKQKEPKKETPEETAMKRTRELRSVRVSNLPYEVELAAVQNLFKQFGEVKEVVLKRGFAYVEFHTVTGATNVLTFVRKNDLSIEDPKGKPRTLSVEQRKPKYEAEPDKPFYMTEKIAFEAKKKQEVAPTTVAPVS